MKHFPLQLSSTALVLASLLMGCNRTDVPAETDGSIEELETGPHEVGDRKTRTLLPRGIGMGYDYIALLDEVSESKPNEFVRRVRVEYLDLSAEQVIDAMTQEFAKSGYVPNSQERDDTGRTRLEFRRAKRATIRVTIREGGKLTHPEARGVIQYNFAVAEPQ